MSSFKEQLGKDQSIFFNLEELAKECVVNGIIMPLILDEVLLEERNRSLAEGTFLGELLFFVQRDYFETKPEVDDRITIDNKKYFIQSCIESSSYYEIVVYRNDSSYY